MLKAGDLALRRAVPGDFESVVAIQRAAYARNRDLLGVEPLPLLADYEQIFRDFEVWVTAEGPIAGVLILEPRADDLLIWSIATDPQRQQTGLGRRDARGGRDPGPRTRPCHHAALYGRDPAPSDGLVRPPWLCDRADRGMPDRSVAHMVKHI